MGTVNYKKNFFTIADFVSWQKDKGLILSPHFQRRSVWKQRTKSYLIDTIVRGLPIPVIFLRDLPIDLDTLKPVREVVDGQQRIRTVLSFVAPESLPDYNSQKDEFTVYKYHNKEIAGKSFVELNDETKRDILDYEFTIHILPATMDDRKVLEIFHRMNSTYYQLNKQELRNSQYFGEFKTLAYQLALECLNYWKNWKIFSDDDIARMKEVKLTSELIMMMLEGELLSGDEDKLIDSFYKKYDESLPKKDKIYDYFHQTMKVIDDHFKDFLPSSKFHEQTKIYIFFAVIYDLLFGLKGIHLKKIDHPLKLSTETIESIKQASENLKNKQDISPEVEKALTSRRKGVNDRQTLFNYIMYYVNKPS